MSSQLSVPKRQVRVAITAGPETTEGYVFVAEHSEHTRGAERIGEILNHPESFLPVRKAGDDRVYLYHKQAIHLLTLLEPDRQQWELEELAYSPSQHVEITLVTGEVLRGITYVDPRPERSRVSDLLNLPDRFLMLVRDQGVTYVAKWHILRVA